MKNRFSSIIIGLIVVLLLGGIALFLAKDNVASFFDSSEDLASLSKPIKITSSLNSIDDSVIKSVIFQSLKNNVNNFDFTTICQRLNTKTATTTEIVKNPDGTQSTTTVMIDLGCRQGNNSPFLLKKK